MKYNKILILMIAAIFLYRVGPAHAEIIQGNSSSTTSVTTNIQGSGSVHTYIQSTVNGQTKTLESNKPGTYTLHNSSTGSTSSSKSSVHITITANPTPTLTATPSGAPKVVRATYMNVFTDIRLLFHQAVQGLLSFFHL